MSRYEILPARAAGGRRILTGAEMQAADRLAIDGLGLPAAALMESAGRHVAIEAAKMAPAGRAIAVVCGRGNNGGDGLVAARLLSDWGRTVEVILCGEPSRTSDETRIQLRIADALGLAIREVTDVDDVAQLPGPASYGLIVDALLGTGVKGAVRGLAAEAIAWMIGHEAPILAVDVPSGVCSDTGQVLGVAVRADATVTFAASKLGHWLFPGAGHVGRLVVVDIGIPDITLAAQGPERLIMGRHTLSPAFARRPQDSHKGTFGHVYVLAGSPGKTGAARMAGDAAMRAGAGLVTLGTGREAFRLIAGELHELMAEIAYEPGEVVVSAAERLAHRMGACQAAAIGPGLPPEPALGDILAALLPRLEPPAVVDAEALNLLARRREVFEAGGPRILTPHPGEAGRLLGKTTAEIQADRVGAALTLADETGAVVVLKGAHTLVADPDGRLQVCPDGNAGMASAGMGDVLTGIIAALLARGLSPFDAATAGVVWHAQAADCAAERSTESALSARDVIAALPEVERKRC